MADPGFTHVMNPYELKSFLPAQRDALKKSTFRMVELTPELVDVKAYASTLNDVKKEDRSDPVYLLAQQELAACKAQRLSKCRFPSLVAIGTAFLGTAPGWKGTYLVTVKHNLRSQVDFLRGQDQLTEEKALSGSLPAHFLLQSFDGKTVYDTRRAGQGARIRVIAEPQWSWVKPLLPRLPVPAEALDLLAIELEGSLSVPTSALSFGTNALGSSQQVFTAGYPTQTRTRFDGYGVADSDGKSLYVTTGWTTSPAHAWAYITGTVHANTLNGKIHFGVVSGSPIPEDLEPELKKAFFNFGIDGVAGLSGAAVVDRQGTVIGVFRGTMGVNPEFRYLDFAAIGLHSNWIQQLFTAASAAGVSL